MQSCILTEKPRDPERPADPCIPSPCGPNAECQTRQGSASCTCLQGFIGSPPSCRPECTIDSECPSSQACINNKCRDPCPGSCGTNALCQVISHIPSCSCLAGHTGDPFSRCLPIVGEFGGSYFEFSHCLYVSFTFFILFEVDLSVVHLKVIKPSNMYIFCRWRTKTSGSFRSVHSISLRCQCQV